MGITVQLVAVPPSVLEALRRHPSVLDLVFECSGKLEALRERAARARSGVADRFVLGGVAPAELDGFLADPGLEDAERCTRGEVDLDKTWAGIHFLLTGEPEPNKGGAATTPLAWALGGSEAALEGTPYQVAPRVVGAQPVVLVAGALKRIDASELRTRFDPHVLERAGVYPDRLWRRADAAVDLFERFAELVWFYKLAASRGQAVLICTTL